MVAASARAERGDDHGRAVRARAEALAEQASRRFAQLLAREGEAATPEAAPGEAAGALSRWIAHSERAYRSLVERLARGVPTLPPPATPAAPEAGADARPEGVGLWLMRSRALFEAAVRRFSGPTMSAPSEAPRDAAAAGQAPIAPSLVPGAREASAPENKAQAVDSATPAPAGEAGRTRAEGGEQGRPLALRRRAAPPTPGAQPPLPRVGAVASAQPAGKARGAAHRAMAAAGGQPARRGRAAPDSHRQLAAAEARRPGVRLARVGHRPRHLHALRGANKRTTMRRARAMHGCRGAGQRVALPGWYVVAKGDTLSAIALRHYGAAPRYRQIAAANRGRLRSRNLILPCQRLYLPRAARRH